MNRVTPEEIRRIARLAAMDVSAEAEPILTEQIARILDYVSQLDTVDPGKMDLEAPPLGRPAPRPDVPRAIELAVPLARNAPAMEDGLFLVPKVPALDDE